MDQRVHVPIDDPNADTEWNDILRKHGVIPEKPPSPTPIIQEAIEEAVKRAHENRLEDKDLAELDELEDDEDEAFLNQYRRVHQSTNPRRFGASILTLNRAQRMAELSALSRSSIYNQVYPIQKPGYAEDVTAASHKAFVLVHLTSSLGTNVESRLLSQFWRELARKFGEIKFCEIRADLCIEGYPERNTPTILIYRNGDISKQVVTLKELGGENVKLRDLQSLLVDVGAIKAKDHRLREPDLENESSFSHLRSTTSSEDDD